MELSYRRHRFPPVVIQHAVWPYLRFTLSYRDVEDLLAERGLDISYETVRIWVLKFGPLIARRLRRRRPRPSRSQREETPMRRRDLLKAGVGAAAALAAHRRRGGGQYLGGRADRRSGRARPGRDPSAYVPPLRRATARAEMLETLIRVVERIEAGIPCGVL